MWGFTESQETVGVSPAMYREFIFPYEKPIMDRFGLNCYGCCEPLHQPLAAVKQHPRCAACPARRGPTWPKWRKASAASTFSP